MHAEEPTLTREDLHRVTTRTLVMAGDSSTQSSYTVRFRIVSWPSCLGHLTVFGRETRPLKYDHHRFPDHRTCTDLDANSPETTPFIALTRMGMVTRQISIIAGWLCRWGDAHQVPVREEGAKAASSLSRWFE
jgi:hypothetical protein